ncbi:hypothetical protein IVB41_27375 [Bradyrhizobium sp. 44]|uniref:hypothetical protein n=1 Tax=Bradyrhizobium sp. 44 TaxID=2782675 RepID=UPI001FF80FF7|nr:hypothetical protein [Bradyrhizobium sp. 44]MCK1287630.1 hypothetical protein [Bradyrhizobium sp. 44]
MKKRLRDQYRSLDPVALLAEIRATQDELGNRVDRRAGQARGLRSAHTSNAPVTAATFAKTLGKRVTARVPRAGGLVGPIKPGLACRPSSTRILLLSRTGSRSSRN